MLLVTMTTMIPPNENYTLDTDWAYGVVYDLFIGHGINDRDWF